MGHPAGSTVLAPLPEQTDSAFSILMSRFMSRFLHFGRKMVKLFGGYVIIVYFCREVSAHRAQAALGEGAGRP